MATMKRFNRWMIAFGGFIAIAALLTALTFSTRAYVIERTISILLDSEIFIDEVADIELGKLFSASLRGVRMDHSDARLQADFLVVEMNLVDWFYTDEINLTRILVGDAELQLKPSEGNAAAMRRPLIPLAFGLQNLTISYADEDQDWDAQIVSCIGKSRQHDNLADLVCNGELNKAPFTISGHYGLPDEASTEEPLDIAVEWGDLSLTAKGVLDSLFDLTGVDLDVTINSPDVRPLLYLLGVHELRHGNISVNAHIADHKNDDTYEFNIDGSIAGFTVRMDGTTQHVEQFDSVDASFLLSGPSLHEAGAIFNELRLEPKPFLASGNFSFKDTVLDIPEVNLQIEQGTLTASARIPELPDTTGMHLNITGKQFRPNFVKPIAQACNLPAEPLDIIAEVSVEDIGQRVFIDARNATFHLNAIGTINESPGDADLNVTARGTTMAMLGQCFGIKLPGIPVRAAAVITKQGDHITLDKLRMDSNVIELNGLVNIVMEPEVTFDTTLTIKVPNARELAAGLLEDPGPVRAFPFESSLSAHGSRQLLVLDQFKVLTGEHSLRAAGIIGDTSNLHGLNLELAFSGDDLRHLLQDPERQAVQAVPYSFTTKLENQQGVWLVNELHATLAAGTVDLSARITGDPRHVGSTLKIKADGKNIENLMGPWVSHPLPSLPFSISANLEATDDLLDFTNLDTRIGEHELSGNVSVDRPPNFSKTTGELSLKGPSTTELSRVLGVEYQFLDRSYLATFQLEGSRDELILNDFSITIGESDLSGRGTFQNTQPPSFELNLRSESLYLPLLKPDLITEMEAETKPTKTSSFFSSTELTGKWLDFAEGELKLTADKVWASAEYSTSIETELTLSEGELTSRKMKWDGDHSKGELDLTLSHIDDQFKLNLDVESSRLPIVWLFAGEALPSEGTSFHASVDSHGNSVKSLMGNLNGAIIFKGGRGKVEAGALDSMFGDFFHTVSRRLVTKKTDRRTNLSCMAGGIQIENGMSSLEPGFVVRTDQVNLYASGSVDLRTEQPNLAFMTKPRTGIGISAAKVFAPRLRVKGTLAKPSFSADSKSSALSAYAAFISGGVSVLATGLWDSVTRSKDPCGDMYELAREEIEIPNK